MAGEDVNIVSSTHVQNLVLSILFMCVCLGVCVCTPCVTSTQRGQKRAHDPLELELHAIVSHHAVLATKLQSSAGAVSAPSTEPSLQPLV